MNIPMLRFLYRKMWNTRWLTLSTLFGLIIAVSFTTSIPMYSDGALKRVVAKSLEEKSDGLPAGSLLMSYQAVGGEKTDLNSLHDVDSYIRKDIPDKIGFPNDIYSDMKMIKSSVVKPEDPANVDPSKRRQMTLATMNSLSKQIELSDGKMFGSKVSDGTIEAVVYEEAMYRNDFRVGDVFLYPVKSGTKKVNLRIKVVGAFQPKNANSAYWYKGFEGLTTTFLVDDKVFEKYILKEKKVSLHTANWYYSFDLSDIKTSQLSPLSKTLERMDIVLYQKLKNTKVDLSFLPMLGDFKQQSVRLQTLLFTLAAPMIAMAFYYIAMNSRQSLERQRSDIAVIRSRGGSTKQIILIYILEGIVLGAIALLIGPLIGWFMAKSIGSSSGFLTFVDRKSIPVGFTHDTMLYGLLAVLIAIGASVIPAIQFARLSIVNYKQQIARADRRPIWQRWFLDVLLLAVAGYGWYLFNQNQMLSLESGLSSEQLQVHPLLFFVPALTIFALGLCFLRLFPWLLRLLNWLGKRFLPLPLYLTLTQLSRSAKAYYPLMLLLVLTLGLGVYNSSAARTIDMNSTERTLYKYGTDVVIQTVWDGYSESTPQQSQNGGGSSQGNGGSGSQGSGSGQSGDGSQGGTGGQQGGGSSMGSDSPGRTYYEEPPFEIFRHLDGVKAAARVLTTKGNVIISGKSIGSGKVMGIDNVDFSKVAWFRQDLFPTHPFRYLNLLGAYEQAVIISSNVADEYQVKPGDVISIAIDQQMIEFVVVGILPYWPSQYPDEMPFFIANLDYIYDQIPMIPYDVWLKMKDNAKVAPLLKQLAANDIEVASYKDVRNELITQKKLPSRGGVFGILSLGFLVSVIISLIGYFLYWFFNLSSRVVQFGVLRAMGLSRKQLTGMLLLEQIFTAGLSIGLGIGIGKLVSLLFLPFLQTSDSASTQVPPFRVIFESRDTYELYLVVAVMMLTGASMLLVHIRRLKVHQAVKLGEER